MRKEKVWYEKLGYKYNPFTIKPGFFDDEVVGYDKEVEKLIKQLNTHTMVFLEGEYGQGKTTILKYLINEFSGKKKVIYINIDFFEERRVFTDARTNSFSMHRLQSNQLHRN